MSRRTNYALGVLINMTVATSVYAVIRAKFLDGFTRHDDVEFFLGVGLTQLGLTCLPRWRARHRRTGEG